MNWYRALVCAQRWLSAPLCVSLIIIIIVLVLHTLLPGSPPGRPQGGGARNPIIFKYRLYCGRRTDNVLCFRRSLLLSRALWFLRSSAAPFGLNLKTIIILFIIIIILRLLWVLHPASPSLLFNQFNSVYAGNLCLDLLCCMRSSSSSLLRPPTPSAAAVVRRYYWRRRRRWWWWWLHTCVE